MLRELIQQNYPTVVGCLCFLVFLATNHMFDGKTTRLFLLSTCCVLLLAAADSLELWSAGWAAPSLLRVLMSAIGYTLRPAVAFLLICILHRERSAVKKWLAVLLGLNALCAFSALFCPIMFSYSPDNQFVRGPLGYFSFAVSAVYLVCMVACTVSKYREGRYSESLIALCVVLMCGTATVAESVYGFDGLLNVSCIISVIFYYLYLQTQQFKRDPLTGLRDRRCFYLDAEKNLGSSFAVVSLDMNGLKRINDTQGHTAGDQAICAMVEQIKDSLLPGCHFYRVGGDEFMILSLRQSPGEVEAMVSAMRAAMAQTPFSCAIGTAFYKASDNFERVVTLADAAMYEDKRRMKDPGPDPV